MWTHTFNSYIPFISIYCFCKSFAPVWIIYTSHVGVCTPTVIIALPLWADAVMFISTNLFAPISFIDKGTNWCRLWVPEIIKACWNRLFSWTRVHDVFYGTKKNFNFFKCFPTEVVDQTYSWWAHRPVQKMGGCWKLLYMQTDSVVHSDLL